MHPIVTYFKSGEGETVRNTSIVISEDNNHDYHAVNHFQCVVNNHLEKFVQPERRIIFSDGCSSQYKSKGPFADIANNAVKINRNYFGSEHGKSECDGEIGILNRSLDRAIIGNQVIMNSAEDIYSYCHKHLEIDEPLSTRNFFLVKNGEIDRKRPNTDVRTVNRTWKFHQILNSTTGFLRVRNLSCFCKQCESEEFENCPNRKYVEMYEQKKLEPNVPVVKKEESDVSKVKKKAKTTPNAKTKLSAKITPTAKATTTTKTKPTTKATTSTKTTPTASYPDTRVKSSKQRSCVDNSETRTRSQYFSNAFLKLQSAQTFEELQVVSTELKNDLKFRNYSIQIDSSVNMLSNNLVADKVAFDILPKRTIPEGYSNRLPVRVQGDGNCLARAASVACFGREEKHEEIRVRIVVELVFNKKIYLDNDYLNIGMNFSYPESANLLKTCAMFSEKYTPGDMITPAVIERIFEEETLSVIQRNVYMGIWQMFALSSVLGVEVISVYPELGDMVPRQLLNIVISPNLYKSHQSELMIMWSTTREDMSDKNWIPNHFVPLLPQTSQEDSSIDSFDDMDISLPGIVDNIIDFLG